MSEQIKKIRFTIGDVAYPEMDISNSKNFPKRYVELTTSFRLEKGVVWILSESVDEYIPGKGVKKIEAKKVKVEVLEAFDLYGFFEDGKLYVKTKGKRKRKTSLERLQQLNVLKEVP